MEKVIFFLRKYNFNYEVKNNLIVVKLNLCQHIIIEFDTDNRIFIKDKLVGWNFLTGMIEMDLKKAILFNSIGALLIGIYTIFSENAQNCFNTTGLFLLFITWFIVFANYYQTNLEGFKSQLFRVTI